MNYNKFVLRSRNKNYHTQSQFAAAEPVGRETRLRRNVLLWALVLLPFLTVAIARLQDGPGLADDYGQYLMHARALLDGRPYTDIGYIYSPFRAEIGPPTLPPGLPLTLAAVQTIFGPSMIAMRLVMLMTAVAWVLIAGLYFARHADWRLGAGVALLCGLAPDIAHEATQLLTDLPFAAIVWAIIYVADKPGRMTAGRVVAITLLGIAAAAFRVPAAALFPALLLFTVLRYREHGVRPAIPVMVWSAGLLLLLTVVPLQAISAVRLHRIAEFSMADASINVRTYWPALFESHLHPFPWPVANDVFHMLTGLLMVVGFVAWIRKGYASFAAVFALSYAAMMMLLPISQERYLWPLFPLFVFWLLNGVSVVAARVASIEPARAPAVALVFALVLVPAAAARSLLAPARGDLMHNAEVGQIIRAIRTSPEGDSARVVFYKPRSFAAATGMPAMGPIGGSAECLISELSRGRITHVVLGSLERGSQGPLQQELTVLEQQRPDLFTELRRTSHFDLFHFQVAPAEAAKARAQCSAAVS